MQPNNSQIRKKAINKSHDYSYLYFPLMYWRRVSKLKVGQIHYFSYLSIVFVGLPTITQAFHIASLPFTLPPFPPPSHFFLSKACNSKDGYYHSPWNESSERYLGHIPTGRVRSKMTIHFSWIIISRSLFYSIPGLVNILYSPSSSLTAELIWSKIVKWEELVLASLASSIRPSPGGIFRGTQFTDPWVF